MPVPAIPAAVSAASSWLLPLILSEGLGAVAGTGEKPLPTKGIKAERLANAFKRASKGYRGEKGARETLLKMYGERALGGTTASGAAYKSLKPGAATKLKGFGKMGLAATVGALPFILLPELLGAMAGGEEEMGMEGGGSSPQDLMAMMSGLEGQAARGYGDTESDFYQMLGEQQSQRTIDAARSELPMAGVREDLQALTRGYEDQLAKISFNQPVSLAQAFAMEGIFPEKPGMMNFGSNRINYP